MKLRCVITLWALAIALAPSAIFAQILYLFHPRGMQDF